MSLNWVSHGFSKNDIEVEVVEGVLTVKSVKDVSEDDINFIVVFLNRQFTRKFTLSDDIVVKDGELKDGMFVSHLNELYQRKKKTSYDYH